MNHRVSEAAIQFLQSTAEGQRYWQTLLSESAGYRGFNWLQDAKRVDPKRIAFVGMRSMDWETGSSLGGPLPNLFKNLLGLDDGMYTSKKIC